MVTKTGRVWTLTSSKGRVLGRSRSRTAMTRREKQVLFFKNLGKSSGKKGSLLAKVRSWRGKRPALSLAVRTRGQALKASV